MALLNEKRNQIPLVAVMPVSGDDNSIRGQMRMTTTNGETTVMLCTVSDGALQSVLNVATTGTGTMDYTSVAIGDDGALVSVEHTVGAGVGEVNVTVVGNAITVQGEDGVTTAAEIIAAVEASPEASALVTIADTAGTTIAVAAAANLTGGERTTAAATFDTDLILTAVKPGDAGNDITLASVDEPGKVGVSVVVTGTAIVVTSEIGTTINQDVIDAINAERASRNLVTASGAGTTANTAFGASPLSGGGTTSVWAQMLA